MKNIQGCLFFLFPILIIVLFSLITSFRNINSQTLEEFELEENYSKFQIPSVKVGKNPLGISVDEDTGKLYVTNGDSNSLSIINIMDMKIKNIRLGSYPSEIFINSSLDYVYVLNENSDSVSVIDRRNDTKSLCQK